MLEKRKLGKGLDALIKSTPESDYLLPQEVIEKTIGKYKEAYELLTGKKL